MGNVATHKIDRMDHDQLSKLFAGELTFNEKESLWASLHADAESFDEAAKLKSSWAATQLIAIPADKKTARKGWKRFRSGMNQQKRDRQKYMRWAAAAAVVIFAYILGTQTSTKHESMEIAGGEYTIEAPKGGKSLMTLTDGSKVWLNAGSSLLFDKSFGEQSRNLTLQGEAYFEVAHDAERPFLVETSGITIAALGTAFNVKAYPEDELIETTLVTGSVRIETNAQSITKAEPVVLEPNQKLVFHKNRQSISVLPNDDVTAPVDEQPATALQSFSKIELAVDVDVEVSTSWKDKRWIVLGERLGVFAANIERKYDMVLIFEDAELEDYRVSATLEEETIEQLFNAIRLTIPMDYRIERNQVYLKVNRQLKKKYDRLIHK